MTATGSSVNRGSVSVLTVVKDPGQSQLMATMRSVARQTHGDVRYVLIDGGASGIGARVARRRWPMKEFVLVSEPDRGIYDAMNKAVAHASGEFLLFLNAADTLAPHALERLVLAANASPQQALVYCDYRFGAKAMSAPDHLGAAFDLYNMGVAHQALLMPRSLFTTIGPFRTDFRIVSDHLWMRDARDHGVPFVHLSERLVRIDDRGLSSGACPADLACFEAEAAARVTMRFAFVPDAFARMLFRYRTDPSISSSIDSWVAGAPSDKVSHPSWPRFVQALAAYLEDVRVRCQLPPPPPRRRGAGSRAAYRAEPATPAQGCRPC